MIFRFVNGFIKPYRADEFHVSFIFDVSSRFLTKTGETMPDQFMGNSPVRYETDGHGGVLDNRMMAYFGYFVKKIGGAFIRDLVLRFITGPSGQFDYLGWSRYKGQDFVALIY
jgi:hypothetical protein